MTFVFVDTSELLALLDEDDPRHAEAGHLFRWLASASDLVTTNYVQVEVVALARRRLGRGAVEKLVSVFLPVVRTLWVDEVTHAAALKAHVAGGSASFVDEVSFAVMSQNGIEQFVGFDRDFEGRGFRRVTVPRDTPRQIHEDRASYGSETVSSDLVSVSEISARAGRPINTVQSWRRRHADFPAPVAHLAAGPIWNWANIEAWIAQRSRVNRGGDRPRSELG